MKFYVQNSNIFLSDIEVFNTFCVSSYVYESAFDELVYVLKANIGTECVLSDIRLKITSIEPDINSCLLYTSRCV